MFHAHLTKALALTPQRKRALRISHTALHATYFGFLALEHAGVLGGVCAVLGIFAMSEIFAEVIEFIPGVTETVVEVAEEVENDLA